MTFCNILQTYVLSGQPGSM